MSVRLGEMPVSVRAEIEAYLAPPADGVSEPISWPEELAPPDVGAAPPPPLYGAILPPGQGSLFLPS